ncbi:MAG: hypothetical protein ABIJ61_06880 [bacterium]
MKWGSGIAWCLALLLCTVALGEDLVSNVDLDLQQVYLHFMGVPLADNVKLLQIERTERDRDVASGSDSVSSMTYRNSSTGTFPDSVKSTNGINSADSASVRQDSLAREISRDRLGKFADHPAIWIRNDGDVALQVFIKFEGRNSDLEIAGAKVYSIEGSTASFVPAEFPIRLLPQICLVPGVVRVYTPGVQAIPER